MQQTTLVTGWFRRHGLGFLDVVALSVDRALKPRAALEPGSVLEAGADQYEVAGTLGYADPHGVGPRLHRLTRVVCLLPRPARGAVSLRPVDRIAGDRWPSVLDSVQRCGGQWEGWQQDFETLRTALQRDGRFPDRDWFKANWRLEEEPSRERLLWHVINEAPLATQIAWYRSCSPLLAANRSRIELVELDLEDIERPEGVTRGLHRWVRDHTQPSERLLVNLWGTSTAVQFGWYYLAWRSPALKTAAFLECRTAPNEPTRRFRPVRVSVVPKDPISRLDRAEPTERWESPPRKTAKARLSFFLEQGDNFCILVLGPRGSGKSSRVRECWGERKGFTWANCADFSDQEQAQSALFGHVKGAYTGATGNRKGLLEEADGGCLFLDEVHHLKDQTLAMLLTALQTDDEGFYTFKRLGGGTDLRVKFQLVTASNLPLASLREALPLDFLDRISQRVIHFPGLSRPELPGAWETVWARMDFRGANLQDPADHPWFLPWLASQGLPGNFRDLQRIAILAADHQRGLAAQAAGAELGLGDDLLSWLRSGLALWHGAAPPATGPRATGDVAAPPDPVDVVEVPFDFRQTHLDHREFQARAKRRFAERLVMAHGSASAAVRALRSEGSGLTEATLNRWKRGA